MGRMKDIEIWRREQILEDQWERYRNEKEAQDEHEYRLHTDEAYRREWEEDQNE